MIPLVQVNEFFRPVEKDLTLVYGRIELVTLRGVPLPAHRLVTLVGNSEKNSKAASDLTALILKDASQRTSAVMVDKIIAQQQVVVKPLGLEVKNKKGVMGSAILGDGKPALILDLLELIQQTSSLDKKKYQIKSPLEAS